MYLNTRARFSLVIWEFRVLLYWKNVQGEFEITHAGQLCNVPWNQAQLEVFLISTAAVHVLATAMHLSADKVARARHWLS